MTASDTITVINWLNSRLSGAGPGPVDPGDAEGEASNAYESTDSMNDLLTLLAMDIVSQPKRRRNSIF